MIGCHDQWEAELEKVSKGGLICLVKGMLATMRFIGVERDRDDLLKTVREARRTGRIVDLVSRLDRWNADPDGEFKRSMRRRVSAKKAARRRKKERKA